MAKRLFFIYNPHSGKEQIKGKFYNIIKIMTEAGYEITLHPTRYAGDATKKIEKLSKKYTQVVCAGGDGTLDEVVSGMMKREEKIPIGYIPSGTCNDFAKSLGIPRNMEKAAQIAVSGNPFACDVGTFNEKNFVYIAAFGIFTDVSYTTKQEVKNVLGNMAYLLEGMKKILEIKAYHLKVVSEEKTFEGEFLFGMITNSKSVGGFKSIVGKNVVFDDGVYEVTFIRRPKNPLEMQELLTAMLIEEIDSRYMISFRSSKVVIESMEEIPWTLDGEFGGNHKYVEIINNKKAVEIMIETKKRKYIRKDSIKKEKIKI